MSNTYLEAFHFANDLSMLNLDEAESKQFANEYSAKCTTPGRLTQQFYDDAHDVAYLPWNLDFDGDQIKRFIKDYALSCHSSLFITKPGYKQIDTFARDFSMMYLDDEPARNFIYRFLLQCGRENYLTEANWQKIYNFAVAQEVDDPQAFAVEFFSEFREMDEAPHGLVKRKS